MLRQQRAQPVGDVIFKLQRRLGRPEPAVEGAVAVAAAFAVGQRVGDRHQRQAASRKRDGTGIEFGRQAADRLGAADLVAMHRAEHDQAHAGLR